jgi:hypothetical protein
MFTSPLAEQFAPDLLDRFLRYVRVDTQSARDRAQSPSTPGQLDLGRMLADELRELGLEDAFLDENGYVLATLPATVEDAPVIGVIAHVDHADHAIRLQLGRERRDRMIGVVAGQAQDQSGGRGVKPKPTRELVAGQVAPHIEHRVVALVAADVRRLMRAAGGGERLEVSRQQLGHERPAWMRVGAHAAAQRGDHGTG